MYPACTAQDKTQNIHSHSPPAIDHEPPTVVGVPDERLGEEVCACVRVREGSSSDRVSAGRLRDFCKGKMSDYKLPRYCLVLEDFPRTLSGKIQKYLLREQYLTRTFWSGGSYWHQPGEQPLKYMTLGELTARAAEDFGDREAVVCVQSGVRLTFEDLLQQSDRLAAGFLRLGLRRGDRVAIWAGNSWRWVVSKLAVARAGLVSVQLVKESLSEL
ncbi:hypothetical protein FOCC_FOCC007107 [Frankliniella occidentalis]|nr:hypothetical protein FOCC_FOCC007107 [Frankliniella occidentalis]